MGRLRLALLVTIGWVALVVWRLRVKPQALWRGTVLSAGGLTATWILLVLLWQPAVDYARAATASCPASWPRRWSRTCVPANACAD